MKIDLFLSRPEDLFLASYDTEEYSSTSWKTVLNQLLEDSAQLTKLNSQNLLALMTKEGITISNQQCSHAIHSISTKQTHCSELLGSLLLYILWYHNTREYPKIFTLRGSFYFSTGSDDNILPVGSASYRKPLSTEERFELFSSENSTYLDFCSLVKFYFEEVCAQYIQHENLLSLMAAHSFMIKFDPKDTKWFARRGLLQKRLGNFSEALSDLKRFSSFHPISETPQAIKTALIELEGVNALEKMTDYSVH